jgi:peptidoglycan/LPS O-acetylase OafA/YrhL
VDAIDGLRALAVLAVVACHAELGLSGGFVGVDIFFVISGYLITRLIHRDLSAGRFSILEFWERRLRRILPALFVMIAVVSVICGIILLPDALLNYAGSVVSILLMSSNLHFLRENGYFDDPTKEYPLLHTWSLSVEEQFYVLLPLLLIALYRFPQLRNWKVLFTVCGVLMLGSLAAGIVMTREIPRAAYFLLPSRAWEPLLGAMLALVPASLLRFPGWARQVLSLAGLAAMGAPMLFYSSTTPFPGFAALAPCLGTVLVILSVTGPEPAPTLAGRVLTWGPVRFIGAISYSLYLWHWPLLALGNYLHLTQPPMTRRGIVVISLVLAVVSYYCVETPVRKRVFLKSRRSIWASAVGAAAAMLILGAVVWTFEGLPNRYPREARALVGGEHDRIGEVRISVQEVHDNHLITVGSTLGNLNSGTLLWGDSHARAAVPAFELACQHSHQYGFAAILDGAMPLLDYLHPVAAYRDPEAIPFEHEVMEYVRRNQIKTVVLAARWNVYIPNGPAEVKAGLERTVHALNALGVNVYVLEQVPEHPMNVPRYLALSSIMDPAWFPPPTSIEAHRAFEAPMDAFARELGSDQCTFIKPGLKFFDRATGRCRVADKGTALYFDDNHLTRSGSLLMLTEVFDNILEENAERTAEGTMGIVQ